MSLLLALVLLQGQGPELKVTVDRNHVTVGDELVFTARATSRALAPMQIQVPTPTGFELLGRSERTEVSQLGEPSRTTTLELRLHALRAGQWTLGPVRAVQGTASVLAQAVTIQVDEQPAAQQVAANPMLRRLLERAPPPGKPGDPAVSLVVSQKSTGVGEQIDVLTAAWFPRDLRVQLRRPPTLQPPVIEGVWSYPQPVPPGIAATRTVGGTLYDLFVTHQIVFPLVPGRIAVAPAVLKYSVPLALQFFSQEERYTLESAPETLTVAPTPSAGRPASFTGAVGQGIRLERTVNPATVRAGEPVNVAFTLAGEGNPALWPTPALNWPPGARAYPDRTDERVAVTGGRLGGSKTFGFTLVADSAGAIPLPGATYTYFDTGVHEFRTAALSVGVLPVAPGGDAKVARPLPPPLLANRAPPLAWRVANAIPLWLWLAAVVLPPAVFYGRRLRRQRPRRRTPATVADSHGVEAQVESLLAALLPAPEALTESGLVAALRSAGLPQADAEQLVATRERLRALRYGPFGGPVPATLAADARALVRRLAPARRRASAIWAAGIGAALLSLYGGPAAAQGAPSPEQLYGQGSLRAAAEGFARRTEEAPASAASWYNLGAAYYRLGHDGRAAAAWQQALRLAPRNRSVLRALALVPPPESGSAARLWMPPFAWYELALAAVPLWIVGWALISGRGRRRDLGIGTIALAAILGASALALHHRTARPLAIAAEKQPLQLSPHERAPTIAPLDAGAALFVRRRTPAWLMVEAPGGRLGWVQSASVVPLRGP